MIEREMLKGVLKILVLKLIDSEDLYGYALVKKLNQWTDGEIAIKEGTLYPILHNFEQSQDIKGYWKESDTGRKRKYYQITKQGEHTLIELTKKWRNLETATNKVLGG
ncbi:PadR family transcriptional regulator [Gracilibacillus alcaliphilus]|uniref:PadR family transcriptional regulator n=1 Tax=Gracilibacillus alcaliphilus TaxID=1401441 RepID=UPI001956C69F|nr:helix-turn-helix transcriptional regulator [Gracilibacillus alcaliphilus]MBM7676785.1 PadR family transcriptional regulator PadR [Gracilibacillus alcaliphilus]